MLLLKRVMIVGIPENIKRFRKKAKLTQNGLAQKSGLSIASIQGYEQGKYKPKIENLQKIAKALDVPISTLFKINVDGTEMLDFTSFDSPGDIVTILNSMVEDSDQAISESIKDVAGAMAAMAKDEEELLSDYHNLNNYGKEEARKRVNELTEIPKYQKKDD